MGAFENWNWDSKTVFGISVTYTTFFKSEVFHFFIFETWCECSLSKSDMGAFSEKKYFFKISKPCTTFFKSDFFSSFFSFGGQIG